MIIEQQYHVVDVGDFVAALLGDFRVGFGFGLTGKICTWVLLHGWCKVFLGSVWVWFMVLLGHGWIRQEIYLHGN